MTTFPQIIFVAGPTASGKSFLAVEIADFLQKKFVQGSEIINADAIQLYNELKILTAFPSDDQMKRVRHNLFGILSPNDSSSVAVWLKMASEEIKRIWTEQNVAIICGGTGFYLKAVTDGIAVIPEVPAEIRQQVRDRFAKIGCDAFFEELKKIDPESQLPPGDTQRLLRAYEIALFTGKSLSHWWKSQHKSQQQDFRTLSIVLNPPRPALQQVCSSRIQSMMEAGAMEEVRDFQKRYENYSGPLVNAVGYKEITAFLKCEMSREECIEKMCVRTRQYAKRQSTWFRNQMKNAWFLNDFGHKSETINVVTQNIDNS
ncbi:MAG: tRNA (adenosine(37)-N6)-dimethylallyltransferase MiaA [Holosporaceae bacterium]|nr:tRNA (adenosine(37)-N6)-dimethylallyltransferase MiaA [Holosporaceae bacterium]